MKVHVKMPRDDVPRDSMVLYGLSEIWGYDASLLTFHRSSTTLSTPFIEQRTVEVHDVANYRGVAHDDDSEEA
jgi:hypothetical protein